MSYDVEGAVDRINEIYPTAFVVLAGDFNKISEQAITDRVGLIPIVCQPTRGNNILDRIFVSDPIYNVVRVVKSIGKSDHKAVVAYADQAKGKVRATKGKHVYRAKTPTQNASFLERLSTTNFELDDNGSSVQEKFDQFYDIALDLLDSHYPERTITISSRAPDYVTPEKKHDCGVKIS